MSSIYCKLAFWLCLPIIIITCRDVTDRAWDNLTCWSWDEMDVVGMIWHNLWGKITGDHWLSPSYTLLYRLKILIDFFKVHSCVCVCVNYTAQLLVKSNICFINHLLIHWIKTVNGKLYLNILNISLKKIFILLLVNYCILSPDYKHFIIIKHFLTQFSLFQQQQK